MSKHECPTCKVCTSQYQAFRRFEFFQLRKTSLNLEAVKARPTNQAGYAQSWVYLSKRQRMSLYAELQRFVRTYIFILKKSGRKGVQVSYIKAQQVAAKKWCAVQSTVHCTYTSFDEIGRQGVKRSWEGL